MQCQVYPCCDIVVAVFIVFIYYMCLFGFIAFITAKQNLLNKKNTNWFVINL